MEEENKDKTSEELLRRWSPILDNMNMSNQKKDWMSDYLQSVNNIPVLNNIPVPSGSTTNFSGIAFPLVRQVFAKLIGDEFDEEKYTNEKRKSLIGDILNDNPIDYDKLEDMKKDFTTKGDDLVSVQPMSAPTGLLFYMDFVYGKQKWYTKWYSKLKKFWSKIFQKNKLLLHDFISKRHNR